MARYDYRKFEKYKKRAEEIIRDVATIDNIDHSLEILKYIRDIAQKYIDILEKIRN